MNAPQPTPQAIDGIPWWLFALRVILVAVQLILVVWLGQRGQQFFYQGF